MLFWRCFVLPFFLDFRFKLLTFQNDATRRWNVDTQHKMPKAVIAPIGGCLSHLSHRIGAFYLFWLIIADNVVTLLLCCVEKCTHLMSESQSRTCSFILINGQSTWQSQLKSINNLHKQRPMNVCRLVSPFDINLEHSLCWIVDSAHASCCDTEILLTSIVDCELLKRLHEWTFDLISATSFSKFLEVSRRFWWINYRLQQQIDRGATLSMKFGRWSTSADSFKLG